MLNNAVAAEVMNKGRPGDDSLAPQDRGVLERYVEPIMAALRACGASPDTADQRPQLPKGHKKKVYKESVKDLIDAGLLKAGTMLAPLRKGLTQTALVLPDGNLKIGEQVFSAVSPAAMAVSGHKSEPGWDFWGAPSGEGGYIPLSRLRDRLREGSGKATDGGDSTPAPAVPTPVGLPPLTSAENMAGHAAPAAALGTETAGSKKSPRQFSETVLDLLDAGLLQPGVEFRSVRKALSDVRATLHPDGRLNVNDEVHGSLSAAAVAVSGNKAEPVGSSGLSSATASSSRSTSCAKSFASRALVISQYDLAAFVPAVSPRQLGPPACGRWVAISRRLPLLLASCRPEC